MSYNRIIIKTDCADTTYDVACHVVPFRARPYLNAFVPALPAYFTRDKLDREIPHRVPIVEQPSELPFNWVALCTLLGETDCVCFTMSTICQYGQIVAGLRPHPALFSTAPSNGRYDQDAPMCSSMMTSSLAGGTDAELDPCQSQSVYANSYWGWKLFLYCRQKLRRLDAVSLKRQVVQKHRRAFI
jgi:hypothetical protein